MASTTASEFKAGVLEMAPVVAAALPIGLLFGALSVSKGLSPLEATLMSAAVFAGAAQFVAVDLWRDPVPWQGIVLITLVVNLRHILMGASLGRHLGRFTPASRPLAMFVMADEVWAFAERRALKGPLPPAYYWGMGAALWLQWALGTAVGASLGASFGEPATYGFDFAFTALFICIIAGFWRGSRTGAILAASAAVSAATSLVLDNGWNIALGGLAGVAVAALLGPEPEPAAA